MLPFDLRNRLKQRRPGLGEILELHAQELFALRDVVAFATSDRLFAASRPRLR